MKFLKFFLLISFSTLTVLLLTVIYNRYPTPTLKKQHQKKLPTKRAVPIRGANPFLRERMLRKQHHPLLYGGKNLVWPENSLSNNRHE